MKVEMKIKMKRIRRNPPTGATNLWVCYKCTFQSKTEDALKEHKKVKKVDNDGWKLPTIYICDLCEKSYNSQKEFKKHTDELHRKKKCNKWNYICKGELLLTTHKKKNHNKHNVYPCDICGQKANSLEELDIHKKIMHSQNKIYCQYCDFNTKENDMLDKHLNFHQGI